MMASHIALAEEITPDTQGTTSTNNGFMNFIQRPDEELLIFELKIGSILLEEALITYQNLDTDIFHIPFADFVAALELPIVVNATTGTADGWTIDEGETFALSLLDGTVTLRNKEISLGIDDVQYHEDGIYVSLKALEKWLPITIDVNFSDLAIIVSSLRMLPIQNRLARDEARTGIKGNALNNQEAANMLERPEAPSFTLPFIDTSVQSTYTNDASVSKALGLQYSANARSIIAGQDALYTISDQINDDNSPDVRLTVGKKAFGGERLFAGLAEYALGDVSTYRMPMIASGRAGRGLFFTNISPFKESLGGSNTTTLRGNLPVGYQVDIKHNGELLAFVEEPDANGEYVFEDLVVVPGVNVFELVFYGPQGQEIIEEKRIFVPLTPVEKGSLEYRVHAIQDNTNLFTNRDDSDEDTGKLRVTGEVSYGLSDITSIRIGAADYSLDGRRKQFGLLGLSTSWKGLRFDLNQAANDEGTGSSIRIESVFKGFVWQAQHQYYNKYLSEDNSKASITGDLEQDTDFRISGIMPFLPLKNMPLTFQLNRQQNTQNDEWYEWSLRATKNIGRIRLSTKIEQDIPSTGDTQTDLNFQVSTRFDDFTLRGTTRYKIEPDAALESVNLTSDIKIDTDTKLRLGLSRSGSEDPLHSFTLGLNKDIGSAQIGFNTTYDDNNSFSALLGASFGFAYDTKRHRPYFSSKSLSGSSALFAKAYRDFDGNSQKDEEDFYLEQIGFDLAGNEKEFVSDSDGIAFIPEINAYERSEVEILSSTFPNPFMKSPFKKIDYLMRPSQIHTYEYPVVLTGEIDGNITIFKGTGTAFASSIIFEVLRDDDSIITSGTSEYDGFLLISDVPIGEHRIAPQPAQLEKLGYCPVAPQPVLLTAEEPFYTVPDEFRLYPNPTLIDDNQWLLLAKDLGFEEAITLRGIPPVLHSEEVDSDVEQEDQNEHDSELIPSPQPQKRVQPLYIFADANQLGIYSVLSGPYEDLRARRVCKALNENDYSCKEIIELTCEDYQHLDTQQELMPHIATSSVLPINESLIEPASGSPKSMAAPIHSSMDKLFENRLRKRH